MRLVFAFDQLLDERQHLADLLEVQHLHTLVLGKRRREHIHGDRDVLDRVHRVDCRLHVVILQDIVQHRRCIFESPLHDIREGHVLLQAFVDDFCVALLWCCIGHVLVLALRPVERRDVETNRFIGRSMHEILVAILVGRVGARHGDVVSVAALHRCLLRH